MKQSSVVDLLLLLLAIAVLATPAFSDLVLSKVERRVSLNHFLHNFSDLVFGFTIDSQSFLQFVDLCLNTSNLFRRLNLFSGFLMTSLGSDI